MNHKMDDKNIANIEFFEEVDREACFIYPIFKRRLIKFGMRVICVVLFWVCVFLFALVIAKFGW